MVIAIDVITDELCTTAVKTAPISTSKNGFLKIARKLFTSSSSEKSDIEPLISESPTNSMPKPAIIPPVLVSLSFLENARMNAPTPANAAKITEVDTEFPPKSPKATI